MKFEIKVEIKIRKDNERGLFSIDNIKKGELICILPIDYLYLGGRWYTLKKDIIHKVDFRYGVRCQLEKNGNEFDSFCNFLQKKDGVCYKISNMFKTYDYIEIIGVSDKRTANGIYVGHIINDYVDMSFLTKHKYEKASTNFSNAKFMTNLEVIDSTDVGIKIIATRDIKKGEEIFTSYGYEYWNEYSNNKNTEKNINLHLLKV